MTVAELREYLTTIEDQSQLVCFLNEEKKVRPVSDVWFNIRVKHRDEYYSSVVFQSSEWPDEEAKV